jgi:hypothetical protein
MMQVSILALHVHRLLITLNCALWLTATQAEAPLSEEEENAYVKLESMDPATKEEKEVINLPSG